MALTRFQLLLKNAETPKKWKILKFFKYKKRCFYQFFFSDETWAGPLNRITTTSNSFLSVIRDNFPIRLCKMRGV